MNTEFHAIVIGGGYAGMSAALQLARARRKVLVVDAGQRRNRYTAHAHGFLGQDGRDPAAIAADGRVQLLGYPTVRWVEGRAAQLRPLPGDELSFAVTLEDGGEHTAQRLVLAGGVRDELPSVPGLAERWGQGVYHCPYCDGYERELGAIGVLASSPMAMHHALMLPDWGTVTLFLNGAFEPDDEQLAALARRGVRLERTPLREVGGHATVTLQDGRSIALAGLFVQTRIHIGPLPAQLGCALEDGAMGPYVRTDMMKATSVAGVFCCGDAARMAGNVALAVADGAMAGAATHQSLIFGARAAD